MRRFLATFAAAATAMTVAPPAQAAAARVEIRKIYYDSPGSDRRSNKSLNAEYVQIHNRAGRTINLAGWTLHDRTGYRYTFDRVRIKPRQTITIHTGRGHDTAAHLYWGRRQYVWNNDEDKAHLRSPSGKLVDFCSYDSTRYDYRIC
ncbi:lamin tail domain-containing protein [Nonomuraea fastidiosa]|uniref:lamin tail domain-containing protein n=1 Tax=Nonomuraea fastidiosa TaxID=46173 RepID=UPI00366E812C